MTPHCIINQSAIQLSVANTDCSALSVSEGMNFSSALISDTHFAPRAKSRRPCSGKSGKTHKQTMLSEFKLGFFVFVFVFLYFPALHAEDFLLAVGKSKVVNCILTNPEAPEFCNETNKGPFKKSGLLSVISNVPADHSHPRLGCFQIA